MALPLQRRLPGGSGPGVVYALLLGIGAVPAVPLLIGLFFSTEALVSNPPRGAGAFFWVTAFGALLGWTRHTPWHKPNALRAGAWMGTLGVAGLLAFSALHLAGELTEILR